MHRQSGSVSRSDDAIQIVLNKIRGPAIVGGTTVRVKIGIEKRRSLRRILDHAVSENFDGVGA